MEFICARLRWHEAGVNHYNEGIAIRVPRVLGIKNFAHAARRSISAGVVLGPLGVGRSL